MTSRFTFPPPQGRRRVFTSAIVVALLLSACGSSDDAATPDSTAADTSDAATDITPGVATTDDTVDTTSDTGEADSSAGTVDIGLFFDGALADEVTTQDCTLSGGAETTCYQITVAGYPASHDVGPFCPSTIEDDAEAGGIWFDGDGVYDLDGQFFVDVGTLYGDDAWQMYDEDGNIYVTETAEEFEAAARPDVDPDLENHCVEGALEWLDNGEAITTTVLIPTEPVLAESSTSSQGNSGVTLDGVVIAASAPVDAILGAYTIAAFDDCGAHFNPFEGYHLHGATGCSELETDGDTADGETPMFGYALDGFAIHSPLADDVAAAADLDECNGHTTDADGYHYHANAAAENQVVECLVGQTVTTGDAGVGAGGAAGERPDGPPPGDDAAGRPDGPPAADG